LIDSVKFNANMTACVAGLTDGTKDITVANITVADTMTASNVVVGNTCTVARLGVTGTLTVSGLLEGSRQFFVWYGYVIGNGSGYVFDPAQPPISGNYANLTMPRSGSVIAITTARYVSACANQQTMTPQIRKNGVALAAAATLTITNAVTGARTGVASTFARDTYQFTEGDRLSAYVVMTGTAGSAALDSYIAIGAEVVFDK
jgi:hypothetical protein